MKIEKRKIILDADEYCLVFEKGRFNLAFLIDRSEKGKSPDIGGNVIELSDDEANKCLDNGFSCAYL